MHGGPVDQVGQGRAVVADQRVGVLGTAHPLQRRVGEAAAEAEAHQRDRVLALGVGAQPGDRGADVGDRLVPVDRLRVADRDHERVGGVLGDVVDADPPVHLRQDHGVPVLGQVHRTLAHVGGAAEDLLHQHDARAHGGVGPHERRRHAGPVGPVRYGDGDLGGLRHRRPSHVGAAIVTRCISGRPDPKNPWGSSTRKCISVRVALHRTPRAAARPAARPENRQPPRKVPSSAL